jgi:hypothetical protein
VEEGAINPTANSPLKRIKNVVRILGMAKDSKKNISPLLSGYEVIQGETIR